MQTLTQKPQGTFQFSTGHALAVTADGVICHEPGKAEPEEMTFTDGAGWLAEVMARFPDQQEGGSHEAQVAFYRGIAKEGAHNRHGANIGEFMQAAEKWSEALTALRPITNHDEGSQFHFVKLSLPMIFDVGDLVSLAEYNRVAGVVDFETTHDVGAVLYDAVMCLGGFDAAVEAAKRRNAKSGVAV